MVLLDNGGGAALGDVLLALPPPDLNALVEHVVVETYPPHAREWRIVPDLSPHFIVSIVNDGGVRRARAFLIGARSRAAVVDVSRRIVTVGVRLRPGAIPPLLGSSAADLTDRAVLLGDAFTGRMLPESEIGADTPPELLLNELLRLVRRAARDAVPSPIGRAV